MFLFFTSGWAQAVAALMIIGLLILIIAFIVSCVALCCTLNISLLKVIGVMLFIVGKTHTSTNTHVPADVYG